jgi:hypothetical protein
MVDEALSPQEREVGSRIASTMRRAFWDKHLEDLSKGNYRPVIDRLGELQVRINGFQRSKAQPVWDLEIVEQIIDNKKFDHSFFASILRRAVDVLYELESPSAHEETVKFFTLVYDRQVATVQAFNKTIVECLEFLFTQLDVLEAELANFRSKRQSMDTKRRQEREVFASLVRDGVIKSDKILKVVGTSTKSVGEQNRMIVASIKKIIVDFIAHRVEFIELPESMLLDRQALEMLRLRLLDIGRLSAFFVGVHAQCPLVFGQDGVKFVNDRGRVGRFVSECVKRINGGNKDELLDEVIAHVGKPVTDKQLGLLKSGLDQCCSQSSQVARLLERRVVTLMETGVISSSPLLPSNALGSTPWFLSACVDELSCLIRSIVEFIANHLHVYLPLYRDPNVFIVNER